MRYSWDSGLDIGELRVTRLEGGSSDFCVLGLRRLLGTRLSLLDESSVTQRPSEKLEAQGTHLTDPGLQALFHEINTGAKVDCGVFVCWEGERRCSALGWERQEVDRLREGREAENRCVTC